MLLVEDHAAVAEATADMIRRYGLDVRIATSGRDALATIGEFNPALVLCDMMLPDMTGLDLVQAMGARPGAADVLIAILTAMTEHDLRGFESHPHASRVNLFLSKPLTNDKLAGLVSKLEVFRRMPKNEQSGT